MSHDKVNVICENMCLKEGMTKEQINDVYYDEITYTKGRYYDTDCYFVSVPKYDSKNKLIDLYVGQSPSGCSPTQYARDNYTTLTINASLLVKDTVTSANSADPSIISNGEIIRNHDMISEGVADNYLYLGIKADRSISEYKVNNTTAQSMLDDGCLQVFDVYYKLVENGVATDLSNVVTNEEGVTTTKHPRQCLGIKSDGTIVILTCDGRTSINAGLTSAETQTILIEKGCVNAWNLDGGGSTSTTIKGSKINRNIDNNGTTDRVIKYTLNAKKNVCNTGVTKGFSKIGEEKQNIITQLIPYINDLYNNINNIDNLLKYSQNISDTDLNTLIGKIIIGHGNRCTNTPDGLSGYFVNIPHFNTEYKNTYNIQLWFSRDKNTIYTRRQYLSGSSTVFSNWSVVGGDKVYLYTDNGSSNDKNTISAADTYQTIKISNLDTTNNTKAFELKASDKDSTTGYYNAATSNYNGYVTIKTQLQFHANAAGVKFIKITCGSKSKNIGCTASTNTENNLSLETYMEVTSGDKISFQMYGSVGDYIKKGYMIIEN